MNKKLLVVILSMTLINNVSPCFAKLNKPTIPIVYDPPHFPSELCVEKHTEGFVCSFPKLENGDNRKNATQNQKEKHDFEELNQSIF
jgi:hypothetical protein